MIIEKGGFCDFWIKVVEMNASYNEFSVVQWFTQANLYIMHMLYKFTYIIYLYIIHILYTVSITYVCTIYYGHFL